jgi:hypothetical protein
MAGAGYKLFNTGDVLTAAQVNTYLQEQVVMVFANAAARTTALTSVLAEGMVSYLKDTNATEVYDGSAWVAIGNSGDITGVTAGTGISGGGTSGTVTITNAMATEITAAGDIIVGTGSGTFDNLPIGTTGQVLTADTTVSPYKVKWASSSSNYSLAASGSLSGGSVSVTGLSGTDFIVELNNATMTATNAFVTTINSDTTSGRYYRNDSGSTSASFFTRNMGAGTGYYVGFKIEGGNGGSVVQTGDYNIGGGVYNQTTAITSIQLVASGTTWSAGTYKIYSR